MPDTPEKSHRRQKLKTTYRKDRQKSYSRERKASSDVIKHKKPKKFYVNTSFEDSEFFDGEDLSNEL